MKNLLLWLPSKRFVVVIRATQLAGVIEKFVTRHRPEAEEAHRVLATVLFTDFVNSTGKAVGIEDWRWRELLDSHSRLA